MIRITRSREVMNVSRNVVKTIRAKRRREGMTTALVSGTEGLVAISSQHAVRPSNFQACDLRSRTKGGHCVEHSAPYVRLDSFAESFAMSSSIFAFRSEKKIGQEFVRILHLMANRARALIHCSDLSASIHETRVLIKHLRALLWFAKHTLPAAGLKRANLRLRKASHLLATQRDLTVMLSTLKKLSHDIPRHKDRKILTQIPLIQVPQQATDQKPEQSLRHAIKILLETLEQVAESVKTCSQWPSPSDRLAKAFHAEKKAGKKVLYGGEALQFHTWRKKAKRLLYQLQLTYPTPDRHEARAVKRVDKLQSKLGDYHDCVVAQDHLLKKPPHQMSKALVNRSLKLLEKRKKHLQKKTRKLAKRINRPLLIDQGKNLRG